MRKMSVAERLNKYVAVDAHTGCWNWTSTLDIGGYGVMGLINGKNRKAHVVAYEYWNGNVPDGLVIDHLCSNRRCVNPAHLEAVTHRENVMRSRGLAAINARKNMCVKGHEFSKQNTYHYLSRGNPARMCRKCNAERMAKRRTANATNRNHH